MATSFKRDARLFKALSDEKRLAILELLGDGELCACVLMERMNIPQSSLSYHMKILCQAGVVDSRQEGKWTHYRLNLQGGRHGIERLTRIMLLGPAEAEGRR